MPATDKRTEAWLGEPGRLNQICDCLANGGDLLAMCRVEKVKYSKVILWLNKDPGRRQAYESAVKAQKVWAISRLIEELEKIALVDLREAYDENNALLPVQKIPRHVAQAIKSIESREEYEDDEETGERMLIGYTKKVTFSDKLKGIELYGKNLRMFVDKVEHEAGGSLADLVRAAAATGSEENNSGTD